MHGNTDDLAANQRGRDIERGVERKAAVKKTEILHQRVAQVTDTDDDDPVLIVHAQNAADLRAKFADVVAVSLLAELTEAAEILTDLRGGDAHSGAQRVGGDAHDTLVVEIVKIAIISGQTTDYGI